LIEACIGGYETGNSHQETPSLVSNWIDRPNNLSKYQPQLVQNTIVLM